MRLPRLSKRCPLRSSQFEDREKEREVFLLDFSFLFFEIGSGADPHPPAGARGRMAVGVSACPQIWDPNSRTGGSLAGWLLGLMAMRWPGSRGRIWSWSASHQADRGADHEEVEQGQDRAR